MRALPPGRGWRRADWGQARRWSCVRQAPPDNAVIRERPPPGARWSAIGRVYLHGGCSPGDGGPSRRPPGPLVHHPRTLRRSRMGAGHGGSRGPQPLGGGRRAGPDATDEAPAGGPSIQWPRAASPSTARRIGRWWCTPAARTNGGRRPWSVRSWRHMRRWTPPYARRRSRRLAVTRMPRPPPQSDGRCRVLSTGWRAWSRSVPRMALDGRVPRRHAWSKR
jgi:hypothetical protein